MGHGTKREKKKEKKKKRLSINNLSWKPKSEERYLKFKGRCPRPGRQMKIEEKSSILI